MAKKKDSKVSISSVDKILKQAGTDVVEVRDLVVGDEKISVEIKRYLPFSDFVNMVNSAVNAVFGVDENGAEVYNAEYEDAAKFMAMLIYVANFKAEMSADRAFALLYCTDLYEVISGVWSVMQHAAFDDAYWRAIKERCRMITANAESGLSKLIAQLDKATEVMQATAQVMDGVDPNTLQNALSAMAEMDEEKLVDNILQFREPSEE